MRAVVGSGKMIKGRDGLVKKSRHRVKTILLEHGGMASDRLGARRVARKLRQSTSLITAPPSEVDSRPSILGLSLTKICHIKYICRSFFENMKLKNMKISCSFSVPSRIQRSEIHIQNCKTCHIYSF